MNAAKPRLSFSNLAHSIVKRPINNITSSKNSKINQIVNTVRVKHVTTARPKVVLNVVQRNQGNPQQDLKDTRVTDSGCSSVLQMYDKKNSILFTDTACVVLSPDFKLTDESYVLLIVPRKDNMYIVDSKNVVP
nr:putative ribonuclease H-like domain-containing protein [Tanacetum cinerariifolium]